MEAPRECCTTGPRGGRLTLAERNDTSRKTHITVQGETNGNDHTHSHRHTSTLADRHSGRHGLLLDAGAIVTTGTALVLYQSTLNLNEVAIGILSGLLTLFFALGAVVGGWLGDRFGRRRVFTASLVLYAVGITALMAALHPAMLYVGVVLSGIAIGADLPVSLALIAEEAPALPTANSSLSFGLLFAFAVISAAIGLFWVPRLPKATALEPAEAVFVPEVSTVPTA
ncbi:MAG TPA: MFS transporter [Roseiflexaceae bacterium]|nr:MFS transporter [Roseiflexaceae bacterium]